MESNFDLAIAESQEAFVKQFDPSSETYHHGDPTPVPVGGERVPESMPSVYDKEYIKRSAELEGATFGAEYEKLTELRALFTELKKVLNHVCPPIEAVLRIRAQKVDEAKKAKQTEAEYEKLKKVTEDIEKNYTSVLRKTSYAEKYVDGLEAVCKDAFKNFKDKEDFTNFSFFVKKYTTMCFADANDILAKLKKIKSEFQTK